MPSDIEKKALNKLKEKLEKPKEDAFASDDIVESLRNEFKQSNEEQLEKTDDIFVDAAENLIEDEELKAKNDPDFQEDYLEDEIIGDDYSISKEDLIDNIEPGEKISSIAEEKDSAENIPNNVPKKGNNAIGTGQPIKSNEAEQAIDSKKPAKKTSRLLFIIIFAILIIALIFGIILFL